MVKIYIILSLFFIGCAKKTTIFKQQSTMIVWKSQNFRYSDMGFISDNGDTLKIEIYQSGSAIMNLMIDAHRICMSRFKCLSKKSFNRTQLSEYYPDKLIENIFRGRYIFNGKNLQQQSNGFSQNIYLKNRYDIHYSLRNNKIIFRDIINKIIIKIIKL